jgi:hypothetical protein
MVRSSTGGRPRRLRLLRLFFFRFFLIMMTQCRRRVLALA